MRYSEVSKQQTTVPLSRCLEGKNKNHSAQAPAISNATLNRLAKVEIFAFGHIADCRNHLAEEKDYKLILSRSCAAADFETFSSTGNMRANFQD